MWRHMVSGVELVGTLLLLNEFGDWCLMGFDPYCIILCAWLPS